MSDTHTDSATSEDDSLTHSRERWILSALLVLCVVLRIAMVLQYQADLSDDRDAYLSIARSVWKTGQFATWGSDQPTAFRPPLYPLLIAPISAPQQQLARGIFNILCGVGTVWLVWVTGKNFSLSLSARIIACLVLCVDPLLLRYTAFPMTESLCTLLTAVWLWRLSIHSSSMFSTLMTGALFGLAVLCRPTIWAVGVLYLLIHYIQKWRFSSAVDSQWTQKQWLSCALGVSLVVTPWVLRNWTQFGQPILMTTHGGYTILLGNNEAFYEEVVQQPWGTVWDGSHGGGQQQWVQDLNQTMQSQGLVSELERDKYQSALARETIQAHPQQFLKATLLRMTRFWSLRPTGPAASGLSTTVLWGLRLFYGLLWLALLRGLFRIGQSKAIRQWLPALSLILALTCVHAIYWSNARMRAPTVPAIALITGFALGWKKNR